MPFAILVVDDEPTILESLMIVLSDEGYDVRSASDGRAALAIHADDPADLILSDVMMPELDGTGLLAELRGRGDDTPMILMSAAPFSNCDHPGVYRLGKPFDLDAVIALVQHALDRR